MTDAREPGPDQDQPAVPVPPSAASETMPLPRTPEQAPAPSAAAAQPGPGDPSQAFASQPYPAAPPSGGYPPPPVAGGYPRPPAPAGRRPGARVPLVAVVVGGVLVLLLALAGGFAGGFVVGHSVGRQDSSHVVMRGPGNGPRELFGPGIMGNRERGQGGIVPRQGPRAGATPGTAPTP